MAEKSAKPGKAGFIVSLAVLTVLAVVGGGLVGKVVAGNLQATKPAETAAEVAKPLPYSGEIELRELPPVIVNLAHPSEMRVRLQAAIVFPKKATDKPEILAAKVADDIVAYVKTLTVADLQGAAGLQALRQDLNDRAKLRSEGKIREVVIENLVLQ